MKWMVGCSYPAKIKEKGIKTNPLIRKVFLRRKKELN
jgi:hypothetical protein